MRCVNTERGGKYTFVDLVRQTGLRVPFEEGSLKFIAEKVMAELNK